MKNTTARLHGRKGGRAPLTSTVDPGLIPVPQRAYHHDDNRNQETCSVTQLRIRCCLGSEVLLVALVLNGFGNSDWAGAWKT